jgi:hypothetical protein
MRCIELIQTAYASAQGGARELPLGPEAHTRDDEVVASTTRGGRAA